MKSGPVKQPKALAIAKGDMRPCRYEDSIQEDSVTFVLNAIPEPPNILMEDGRQHWYAIMSDAVNIYGWIAKMDLNMLTTLCQVYDVMCISQKILAVEGYTIETEKGKQINPQWKIYNEAIARFLALSREFGISPSSRSSVKLQQKQKSEGGFLDNLEI